MLLGHSELTLPSVLRLIDMQLPQEKVQWAEDKIRKLSEDLKVPTLCLLLLHVVVVGDKIYSEKCN